MDYANTGKQLQSGKPYWFIAKGRDADARPGVLVLESVEFGQILAVFGSQEDAEVFIRKRFDPETRPYPRAVRVGRAKLAQALHNRLASVDRVAFDPSPEPDLAETLHLASIGRRQFMDLVLGRAKTWSERATRDRSVQRAQGSFAA